MSKILNYYDKELSIDKSWYNSSNIVYSECDDLDNSLKKLRVVFKNGRTYEYNDVNVNDYLLFREGSSQGKALNSYIKKYETSRINDTSIDKLNEELESMQEKLSNKPIAHISSEKITIEIGGNVVSETLVNLDNSISVESLLDIFDKLGVKCKKE